MVRRRYEWSWLYAAIEPDTGGDLCRYLSALDGVCFEVSWQHLGERFCGEVIGSVLDNAPAHRWQDARIPENVLLVPLPPYGPELNPVERLFLEFRRELANQLFDSIDAIQSAATGFLERYWADRAALRRLTGLSWWLDAVQELWRHRITTVLARCFPPHGPMPCRVFTRLRWSVRASRIRMQAAVFSRIGRSRQRPRPGCWHP